MGADECVCLRPAILCHNMARPAALCRHLLHDAAPLHVVLGRRCFMCWGRTMPQWTLHTALLATCATSMPCRLSHSHRVWGGPGSAPHRVWGDLDQTSALQFPGESVLHLAARSGRLACVRCVPPCVSSWPACPGLHALARIPWPTIRSLSCPLWWHTVVRCHRHRCCPPMCSSHPWPSQDPAAAQCARTWQAPGGGGGGIA